MKRILMIATVLLLFASMTAHAQDEDPCMFTIGGVLDAEARQCTIQVSINLNVDYPPLVDQPEFIARAITDFIQNTTTTFMGYFTTTPLPPKQAAPWELWIDYEVTQYEDWLVSYKFTIYEYTGGAHGNTAFRTFVFDLENEREIQLSDLFDETGLTTVAAIAQEQLKETLGDMLDEQWLADGTAPTPENYQNFVFTEDALVFTIPQYQVAPYAAGPQTATIQLTDLAGVSIAPFLNAR
jgi:hypothetical protein